MPPPAAAATSFNPLKVIIPSIVGLLVVFAVIYALRRSSASESQNTNQPQQTLATIAYAFHGLGGIIVGQGDEFWLGTASNTMGDALDYLASIGDDDLLGSQTWTFSPAYLASRAPGVGGSFSDTRAYSDGDASYTMTAVVTRIG